MVFKLRITLLIPTSAVSAEGGGIEASPEAHKHITVKREFHWK